MADEEVMEKEETNKKYITATLDKVADADFISRYNRLVKIGGFSSGEVFSAGVVALVKSDQYQKALQALKEELEE